MRALIIIAAIVFLLALVGWVSFSKGPDRSSINIESDKIRQDTKRAMESSAQILHKAGDKVEAEAEQAPRQAPERTSTAPTTR